MDDYTWLLYMIYRQDKLGTLRKVAKDLWETNLCFSMQARQNNIVKTQDCTWKMLEDLAKLDLCGKTHTHIYIYISADQQPLSFLVIPGSWIKRGAASLGVLGPDAWVISLASWVSHVRRLQICGIDVSPETLCLTQAARLHRTS